MRYPTKTWPLFAMLSLGLAACTSQSDSGGGEVDTPSERTMARAEPAPPVDSTRLFHAPEAQLTRARAMLTSDLRSSATDLREAERFLKDQMALTTGSAREDVERSIVGLEDLRDELDRGVIPSEQRVDHAFGEVHRALAEAHLQRATHEHAQQDNHRASRDLMAAASHMEHALAYAGKATDAAATGVLRDTRAMADQLARGAGWTQADLESALQAVKGQLERLR